MGKNENQTNEAGFMDKLKTGVGKFFKGIKNFAVKTGRKNSSNYYGFIDQIGDFLVYNDHALISAVGMDDVVFTRENVISSSFQGLGKSLAKKVTVQYEIVLDDNVVFPEKVRQKNDVKHLKAMIKLEKERSHLMGQGQWELDVCSVYGYEDCFVLLLTKEKQVGEKIEHYQEALLYPFEQITMVVEGKNKAFTIRFQDGSGVLVTPNTQENYKRLKDMEQK